MYLPKKSTRLGEFSFSDLLSTGTSLYTKKLDSDIAKSRARAADAASRAAMLSQQSQKPAINPLWIAGGLAAVGLAIFALKK